MGPFAIESGLVSTVPGADQQKVNAEDVESMTRKFSVNRSLSTATTQGLLLRPRSSWQNVGEYNMRGICASLGYPPLVALLR